MCSSTRRPADAGLTLIELLVGLAISIVLLGSVYYVYALSARGYRSQDQVLRAMDRARFGMEQLRRDLASAAFMATPNSMADPSVCHPKSGLVFHGIAFQNLGDVALGSVNTYITPMSVTMLGSWWSNTLFRTESVVGQTVTLQSTSMPSTQAEFDAIFVAGRYLRIVTAEQYELYYRITGSNFTNRTVTLDATVPTATPPDYCGIQGFGVGIEVNVVGYIRYRLKNDTRAGAPANKVDLVREELQTDLQTPVARTTMVVTEYAVDLQFYDFGRDNDGTRRDPDIVVEPFIDSSGTYRYGIGDTADPQRLRFVTAKLTTRAEDEDPGLRFVPRTAANTPLDLYELDDKLEGAARTVSLAGRVGLKTFAIRNVQ